MQCTNPSNAKTKEDSHKCCNSFCDEGVCIRDVGVHVLNDTCSLILSLMANNIARAHAFSTHPKTRMRKIVARHPNPLYSYTLTWYSWGGDRTAGMGAVRASPMGPHRGRAPGGILYSGSSWSCMGRPLECTRFRKLGSHQGLGYLISVYSALYACKFLCTAVFSRHWGSWTSVALGAIGLSIFLA